MKTIPEVCAALRELEDMRIDATPEYIGRFILERFDVNLSVGADCLETMERVCFFAGGNPELADALEKLTKEKGEE